MSSKQEHPYHLVDMSPWPILTSFSLLALTMGGVMALHGKPGGSPMAIFGLIAVIFCSWSWWKDIVNEGLVGKHHSEPVRNGLRIGMSLFILSEVMFSLPFSFHIFQQAYFQLEYLMDSGWLLKELGRLKV